MPLEILNQPNGKVFFTRNHIYIFQKPKVFHRKKW